MDGLSIEELDKFSNNAIEYIYSDNIPIKDVEVVGVARITDIPKGPDFVKDVLKRLTQNQPEASYFE